MSLILPTRRAALLGSLGLVAAGAAEASKFNIWHRGRAASGMTAVPMGAQTLSGMGDYPIDGTLVSIKDRNNVTRTDLAVSGGVMTVTATWTPVNVAAREPYTVTTDTTVYTVNASGTWVANEADLATTYSVGKQSDWNGTSGAAKIAAATLSGKTISLRAGLSITSGVDQGSTTALGRKNYGVTTTAGLVVTCDDFTNPSWFTDTLLWTSRYVTFRGIGFQVPGTGATTAAFAISTTAAPVLVSDLLFDRCQFVGPYADPNGDYNHITGTPWVNGQAIKDNGADRYSNIRVQGCTFRYVHRGPTLVCLPPVDGNAGGLVADGIAYVGNLVDTWYSVGLKCDYRDNAPKFTCTDNVVIHGASIPEDTSPTIHADSIICTASPTAASDWQVEIDRNFCLRGNARGVAVSIVLRDFYTIAGDSGNYFTGQMIGNVISQETYEAISVQNARDMIIRNNTAASYTAQGRCRFIIGGNSGQITSAGTQIVERNICTLIASGSPATLTSNVTMQDPETAGYTYAQAMVGPTWTPDTRQEAMDWLQYKSSGPGDIAGLYNCGGPGSGAINYAAANPSIIPGSNNV